MSAHAERMSSACALFVGMFRELSMYIHSASYVGSCECVNYMCLES